MAVQMSKKWEASRFQKGHEIFHAFAFGKGCKFLACCGNHQAGMLQALYTPGLPGKLLQSCGCLLSFLCP